MTKKLTHKLLGYAALIGAVFTGYQLFKLVKQNKVDKKSNFSGGEKSIVFTIINNTNQIQYEYLFDSRSGQDNPNVTVSDNLKQFNQELSNSPKLIKKIRFRVLQTNVAPPPKGAAPAAPVVAVSKNRQAEASFQMICATADGTENAQPFTPFISAMQVQQGITTLKMNNYIIDGNCYMKYKLYPNSKLNMIVFYEEKPLSNLLK